MKIKDNFWFFLGISLLSNICFILFYHQIILDRIDQYVQSEKKKLVTSVSHDILWGDSLNKLFVSSAPTSFIQAAETGVQSVVFIKILSPHTSATSRILSQSGSGVVISSDGYIVTNYHVVGQNDEVQVTLFDKRVFIGKVTGVDENTDLALIKIEGENLPALALGNSDSLRVGEWVLGIGNPFNLQSTVTAGIVSAKARNINLLESRGIESFIQTDVAVNPGSSGGALINTSGMLVGINTAIISEKGSYEGFSFAIPVNVVKKVVQDIKEFGVVQRGWLGIEIEEVNDEVAQNVYLPEITGVFISSITKGGAAAECGLAAGDIILELNGLKINSAASFMEKLALFRPGDKVKVVVWRKKQTFEHEAVLKNHLNTTDPIAIYKNGVFKDLGIEVRDMDSLEKSIFGKNGVLVVSIQKNSKLYATKMEPGFIIMEMDGIPVQNVIQLQNLCNQKKAGKTVWEGIYKNFPGTYPYIFDL